MTKPPSIRDLLRLLENEKDDLDPREEAKIDLWMMLVRRFGNPETGRSRAAFRHGDYVIKYPLNQWGERDNVREAEIWRDRETLPYPVARCRLFQIAGIPLLIMEYVEPIAHEDKPDWSDMLDKGATGENMGRRRSGQIVAFDYAGRGG